MSDPSSQSQASEISTNLLKEVRGDEVCPRCGSLGRRVIYTRSGRRYYYMYHSRKKYCYLGPVDKYSHVNKVYKSSSFEVDLGVQGVRDEPSVIVEYVKNALLMLKRAYKIASNERESLRKLYQTIALLIKVEEFTRSIIDELEKEYEKMFKMVEK